MDVWVLPREGKKGRHFASCRGGFRRRWGEGSSQWNLPLRLPRGGPDKTRAGQGQSNGGKQDYCEGARNNIKRRGGTKKISVVDHIHVGGLPGGRARDGWRKKEHVASGRDEATIQSHHWKGTDDGGGGRGPINRQKATSIQSEAVRLVAKGKKKKNRPSVQRAKTSPAGP